MTLQAMKEDEARLLREEVEMLMAERRQLLQGTGAAAVLVANRALPEAWGHWQEPLFWGCWLLALLHALWRSKPQGACPPRRPAHRGGALCC